MKSHAFPARFLLSAAGLAGAVSLAGAAPRITEFLASNPGPETDGQGNSSDWIEIHNPDVAAVNLEGWSLTDDAGDIKKWIFPAVTVQPGEYLVVRASGLNLREAGQELHTNFSLRAGGEYLALFPPAGAAVSEWNPFPKQFSGISYGFPSGNPGTAGWFIMPTPGAANGAEILTDYVQDTAFDVPRGFITGPVQVRVSSPTPGAEIRYTLDGNEPGGTSPVLPSGGLTVSTTTVLRVRGFKTGLVPTNTDTRTFILPSTWVSQPAVPAGFPATWGNALKNGGIDPQVKVKADYQMDPRVTADPEITAALTTTLPVLCVTGNVSEIFGEAGIMGNGRRGDLEEPVSVEYFNPADPEDRFSARASLQVHGGGVREFVKKAFRLDFSGLHGDGELGYPLFPGSETENFDQLVLRPGGHDSFVVTAEGLETLNDNDLAAHASYMRDQFIRRTENRMGLLSPQGRYVHLCLNGLYWGVYDLHERPNARYAVAHQGGKETDWDVIHHAQSGPGNQVVDGNGQGWIDLLAEAEVAATPEAFARVRAMLGQDRFIDHLITRIWASDFDWLGPATIPGVDRVNPTGDVAYYQTKNWYAVGRTREVEVPLWQFFTWDAEISMGNHILNLWAGRSQLPDNFSTPVPKRLLTADFTGISKAGTPAQPWAALLEVDPEFRLRVADRLRRHFFNNGELAPAVAQASMAALVQELDSPMLAETARWGDASGYGIAFENNQLVRVWTNTLITRATYWRPEAAWLRDTFATQRGAIVLAQFKARGIYPAVEPADIAPFGGALGEQQPVTLTQPDPDPGAVLYYTVDGTDPRVPLLGTVHGSALVAAGPVIPPAGPFTLKARVLKGGVWSALTEAFFSAAVPATAQALAITEIHYHPPAASAAEALAGFTGASDFEFIEITNRSNAVVSLTNLRFAAGIDFEFAGGSAVQELAPGSSVVIAGNAAAFQMRYGFSPAGVFANGTALSNSGERIKLVTSTGVVIAEVEYSDEGDWPLAADGGGRSLTLLAPASGSDGSTADQWRPGVPTPGTVAAGLTYAEWLTDHFTPAEVAQPALVAPEADPDGDGLQNRIEYLTMSSPRQASENPLSATRLENGHIRFEWPVRPDASGYIPSLESSVGLSGWAALNPGPEVVPTTAPTTRAVVLWQITLTNPPARSFARLVVQAAAP